MTQGAPRIQFKTNYAKALEAILYILSKRETVNSYNVLKILFEADRYHLNQHGRPVTGDTYYKMDYGTVPSAAYDMIKGTPLALAKLDLETFPFEKEKGHHLRALRKPDLSYLSQSDLEALDKGMEVYLDLSFDQVEQRNHEEKCWQDAEMNRPIPFESIIENKEVLKYLQEMAPLRLVI